MNFNKSYKPIYLKSVCLLIFCLSLSIQVTNAADKQLGESTEIRPSVAEKAPKQQNGNKVISNGAAGMKLHIDTVTGEFVTPSGKEPPVKLPSAAKEKMFSTSSRGLVKRPSNIPGGGESVNLQGRFMSPLILKIGPDGNKSINHARSITHQSEKE